MSSNVGLSTPRGSGTSGYVQRNYAFVKPRNAGYGAPYPPVAGAGGDMGRPFKQRLPDKQILEHDRLRAIEVKVLEERERLEEENERIEEEEKKNKGKKRGVVKKKDEDEDEEQEEGETKEAKEDEVERVLSEEELDERCEAFRARLLKEMKDEEERAQNGGGDRGRRGGPAPPKERKQLKSYQVHELAEAKIEESERLRKALGIKEDRETGEISSGRGNFEDRKRGREHERERY